MIPDAQELLGIALDAARQAGQLLAGAGRTEVAAVKSSPTDVVTEMDRAAESLIKQIIRGARPDDAFLAEESGASEGETRVRWVVDPLDGTVNYLYGLADWAVSIAAEVDGTVVAGVVEVPKHGETFAAVLGGGAWVTDAAGRHELRCAPGPELSQALIGTGFGYLAGRRRVQGEVVAALLPQIRDIRRGGSAAVDLCSVAAGRVDGYYERGLNPWDFAAGALIAAEAGAVVGGLDKAGPGTSMTIAAGSRLYPLLATALTELKPERDAAR
ncbi:MAG: inositol monophosphatase family protein [Streptosporangiaceae bacterium]|jgi:myo-inositol-1(or 4)-monophosphatase